MGTPHESPGTSERGSMKFFLETTDIPLIEKSVRAGVLQGIVTTPSLLHQGAVKEVVNNLLAAQPGPIVVDVYSDFQKNGSLLASISPRIILRIPAVEEGWPALHHFWQEKIPVMAGAIFSPTQALMAARSGAAYVCPHLSRMLKTGERPFEHIESIQKIMQQYRFPAEVMVLHPKSLEQVKVCAEIGVSGVIAREDLYKELLETHELASFHIEQSMEEWKKSIELFFLNE